MNSAVATATRPAGAVGPTTGQPTAIAPIAAPAMVQVPQFDANGQIVKDASGANVTMSVPATSQLAQMLGGKGMRPLLMKVLGLAITAAVIYGAAYYGSRHALRRARAARHESRHSRGRRAVTEAI